MFLLLRVAERFGIDPRIVLEQWSPGLQTLALDYLRVREWQEREELKMLAGAKR